MGIRSGKDDNLFSESSMSFGEHLIELRRCLLNSIYWLVGGFLIALVPLGSYPSLSSMAVSYIQRPLKKSLEHFYITQSNLRMQKDSEYLKTIGYTGNADEIASHFKMTAEEFWIFPQDLIQSISPKKSSDATTISTMNPGSEVQLEDAQPRRIVLWKKLTDDSRMKTKALNMPETFVIFLKAAVFLGIVIASPGIFYNFWSFVGAGLYAKEKKLVYRFLPLSILLFIGGFCLAFFVIFEMVLTFLLEFNASMNIDPDPRITEWLNFALLLPLAFGIAFQLPLVMFALERLGIFTIKMYWARWKISVLVIAFFSMMFTPPDPWSMICLLSALIGLYFSGILLCVLFPKPKRLFDDSDQDKEAEGSDA